MVERVNLGTIDVVVDDDTGIYRIGEVDAGFNGLLRDHIEKYGSHELLMALARLSSIVFEVERNINYAKAGEQAKREPSGIR